MSEGGALEVVLPSRDYRDRKVKPDHAPLFDTLIERAASVHTLPHDQANKDAYEDANGHLVDSCDLLIAIWDGRVGGRSGTASAVEHARSQGRTVVVISPDCATRG